MKHYKVKVSSGFERDARRLIKKSPGLIARFQKSMEILKTDPYNSTREYDIKKLSGVKQGGGQYRIRFGDYRMRYDVLGEDVILYSVRNRKDAY